ncbi:tetratricopeptide repeat protein, partial [bacterium]|nr:tetratricopeptide repeat protein [bacterium]
MNTDYLINLLDSNLQSKLETIKRAASRIWETQKMQHFTKHGISHSENIIGILKLTLEDMRTMKDKLSKHEIFILLASAYLHDIGMQSAYHAGLPDKSSYDIDDKKIIRDRHHETSSKMILKSVDETVKRRVDCGLADCIQPNYVRYIALLSKSHRIGKPGILSNLLDEDYLKTGEKIRVRLLTALLRFADELDRDYLRVNMEELKLWDIPTDSKVYWWMHHYTKAVEIENGRIRILFRIPVNYKDSHMKVDEIIFMETLDCINNQFMEVKNVLWNSKIYLDFDEKPPKEDDGNYTDDSSVFPIPEDVINFINTKFKVQKSAEELTKRTGVVYWVNGIPKSDDETLKKLMDGALTHAEKEEYIQSIEKIESALILTVGPSERMALKLTLGNCYRVIGKNNEAIKNYKDVIAVSDVLDTIDAKSGGIAAYGNLGHIYSIQGDLNKSLEYHFHVFNIYKEIEDLQNQAAALGNIGLIYFDKGDLDNALKYLKDGLKIDQEIGCKQGEANQL